MVSIPINSSLIVSADDWINIKVESFPSGSLSNEWYSYVYSGPDSRWGVDNYRSQTSPYSCYCAKDGSQTGGDHRYENGMINYLQYPSSITLPALDLSDAINAEIQFDIWYITSGIDFFGVYAFNGQQDRLIDSGEYSGNSNGWQHKTLSLRNVQGWGDICGRTDIRIEFGFYSDPDGGVNEGVYIDNVVIRKQIDTTDPEIIYPMSIQHNVLLNFVGTITFGISNVGTETLTYHIYDNVDWIISINPCQGNLAVGHSQTISMHLDMSGLPLGVYSGEIIITTNDQDHPLIYIPITIGVIRSSCFLKGTTITMADNSVKTIENVLVGDLVIAYNEVLGQRVPAKVTEVFHHTPDEMGDFYLVINNNLRVTPNHPLFVNKRWTNAGKVQIGDRLLGVNGSDVDVFSIVKVFQKEPTYNLEVANYHTYFANGILAHNKPRQQPVSSEGGIE
jgi:hypothetical protein